MGYHDDGCIFLRIDCQHPQCKCSECPVTDMWSDELAEYIDKVYESAHKHGYDEAMELLSGTSVAYSFLNDEKRKAFQRGIKCVDEKLTELEQSCLSHTENEIGEWTTMTIDYEKWADLFIKLRGGL